MNKENNYITEIDILDEIKDNFLTYSSEVLTDRAIPAAEDGLLSAQRKILWTMEDYLKMNNKSKTKKCNAIVGSTLATSYFHGDASCYGVLCKMSQDYLMRYPLIEGQGSLGTQENNDMVASSRYCVTGDTLIPTDKGTIKIENIVPNSEESSDNDIDLNVVGIDGKLHKANKLFNSGKYPVLQITLRNGQTIKVTENHPLLVLDENLNYVWKLAENLEEGDKLLLYTPNNIENKNYGTRKDYLEAAMLGCMISEGYATTQNRIGINNKDLEMIDPVVEYIYREVPTCQATINKNEKRDYYEFCFADKYFYPCFIKDFEFGKAENKHLPQQYFDGDLKYKATLLSYLFEGDGSVDIEHGISYSSISELLIHQLQISLLQDFGIVTNIARTKTRNEIKLKINNIYAETFYKYINFVSDRKKKILLQLVNEYNSKSIIANGNLCNIYEITDYIRTKYQGNYYKKHGFSNKKSYKQAKDKISAEDYDKIEFLINNYVYIEISKINELAPEVVYSLRINDSTHAYIGNGFINHNTEAKPAIYADLMMKDFKKNVVPLKETYNGEFMEPVVLPGLFPNAIVNGRQAIGISMAHNSLPHNLTETCNAIIAYIKNNNLSIEELMTYMPGPDFPLHNIVINAKDIKAAFATGKSNVSLKVRGHYIIKKDKIIFDTIPYRTYRNKIREQINKNVDELSNYIEDFDDESNLGQNKLVFTVKKDVNPEAAVLQLFTLTDLQTTLSYNMNYIINGTPKLCSMLDLIKSYVNHQTDVLLKATEYDKNKAEARVHILSGLLLIISNIDKAIDLIKNSENKTAASLKLQSTFSIDEEQAKAVLNMKLSSLTKLDKDDLLKELAEQKAIVEECTKIITNRDYRNNVLIKKITEMKNKYGDQRRTELLNIDVPKKDKEIATVKAEDVVVILNKTGEIKRINKSSFRPQRKNGVGVKSENEIILSAIKTNTIDNLLIFTNSGKMYKILVDKIPSGTNKSKGQPISSLINLDANEKVIAAASLDRDTDAKYVIFITKNGLFKKTELNEYKSIKKSTGTQAIKLKDNDAIVDIIFMKDEDFMLFTKEGMIIRFSTLDINPIGRVTSGVKGIKLNDEDEVIKGIPITNKKGYIAIIDEDGYGKRCLISDFSNQGRGGKGIKSGRKIIGAELVTDEDNLLLLGSPNSICVNSTELAIQGKNTLGVKLAKNKIYKVIKI